MSGFIGFLLILVIGTTFVVGLSIKDIVTEIEKNVTKEFKLNGREINADVNYVSFADALKKSQITLLDLSSGNIGDEDIATIVGVLGETNITDLNLSNNTIGTKGSNAIAGVLQKTEITRLNLGKNNLKDTGVNVIGPALKDSKLTFLDLSSNGIKKSADLFNHLKGSPITELNIGGNMIGDGGLGTIVCYLEETKVTRLNLTNIGFTSDEIRDLNSGFRWSGIKYLNLDGNKIEDEGLKRFAEILSLTMIIELDLSNTGITKEGVTKYLSNLDDTFVETIRIDGIDGVKMTDELNSILKKNRERNEKTYNLFQDFVARENDKLGLVFHDRNVHLAEFKEFFQTIGDKRNVYRYGLFNREETSYTRDQIRKYVEKIGTRYDEFVRKFDGSNKRFDEFVVEKDGSLVLKIDYAFAEKSNYQKFAELVMSQKDHFIEQFSTEFGQKYKGEKIQKFVDNIKSLVTECINKTDLVYSRFEKFVALQAGSFVFIKNKDAKDTQYDEFTKDISKDKEGYINYLKSRGKGDQVRDFVDNIDSRLKKFRSAKSNASEVTRPFLVYVILLVFLFTF